jgi:hypothetical protein
MTITPEEAQKLSNLSRRMLQNIAEDKPSHEGLTKEEIKEALDFVRSGRAASIAAGEKKAGKAKKPSKAKASSADLEKSLSAFSGMSLD